MPPGRPRKRDEDVKHGTDAGYRYCRAGVDGGRCDACKDAHADAEARRAAARRGLSEPPPQADASVAVLPTPAVVEDVEPGPNEQAVLDEIASLSAAVRRPSSVQSALTLARGLDNQRLATSHATMARQKELVMESLRSASSADRGGRLVAVAQMSQRRPKSRLG